MSNWVKISVGVFISFLIIAFTAGFVFKIMLNDTLPEYEGEIESNEISSVIIVYRDSMAVPYIKANNDLDAAFALGYLHAQERLFTMDFARRAGSGRLAEVLGKDAVPFDKMFRTIGINKTAKENLQTISPEAKDLLKAYSAGVNTYINDAKGDYPVEFDVLGYDPYEWKPEDSMILIKMLAWQLNISWWADFSFSDIVAKLGEEKARQILPKYDENGPYIIPSGVKDLAAIPIGLMQTDKMYREMLGMKGNHLGSNAWAISGNKSVTGKPIIANDPHLSHSSPGRWYAAVIKSGNETVAGVTLPGVPGVVIGKNDNIAWSLTNIMADDCDFYNEQIDSTRKKYFLNGEWKDIRIIKESIKVKNSPDHEFVIKYTHRGPIVSDIHPYNMIYKNKGIRQPVLSMKWTANEYTDELTSFYKLNKARNWNDFKNAAQSFSVPGQNFIYADKDGNIGYVFGARLPARTNNSPTFIYDGKTTENDWQGYVSTSMLPMLFNPSQHYVASANNKTVKEFPYHISNIWEPTSRIERITQLLTSKEKHSVYDFKKYQMDQVSPYASKISWYIINAFNNIKVKDRNLKLSLELFRKWNFEMNEFSQVPAVYAVFFKHLLKNIYEDEMGHDLFNEFTFLANVTYRSVLQVLSDSTHPWFDNVKTNRREERDEIIRKSLAEALSELESKYDKDLTYWRWGDMHKVKFRHAFSGVSSIIDDYIDNGPYSVGGDGTTLFNTEYVFNEPIKNIPRFNHDEYENVLGPSMRFIFDFSKPDQFLLVLTTGQSGNVMSDNYKDQTELWLRGNYMTIKTDEASFSRNEQVLKIVRGR